MSGVASGSPSPFGSGRPRTRPRACARGGLRRVSFAPGSLTLRAEPLLISGMRLMLSSSALVLALTTAAVPADTARFQFCWVGEGGYTMRGMIGFPSDLLGTGIITQAQVTEFRIVGFRDDLPVGSWSLDQLTPTTSWELYFDTRTLEFPTGGYSLEQSYQQWNANGEVNDCGPGGFGFNGGNLYQDVCIDNTWVTESSIEPATPFPVAGPGEEARCANALPVS